MGAPPFFYLMFPSRIHSLVLLEEAPPVIHGALGREFQHLSFRFSGSVLASRWLRPLAA